MRGWPRRVAPLGALLLLTAGCEWTTFGFAVSGGRFNSSEQTIGVGNVATLTQAWTATTGVAGSPIVAGGSVMVTAQSNQLEAFDAAGTTGCSGLPKVCSPLWTATTGGNTGSTPAAAKGIVYVGSGDGSLRAFDASGTTDCFGSPKVCTPLWTASTGGEITSSPVVANGVIYVGSSDQNLYAFDATGTTGCSGNPKVCTPLWTAPTEGALSSSPAVANDVVYIGADSFEGLYAFDATGTTGCSGNPKVCLPLWRGEANFIVLSSPAVVNGVVYIGSDEDHAIYAFDATGSTNCSGVPKFCDPLWTGAAVLRVFSSPAVAYGKVYTGGKGLDVSGINVEAFDASGTTGCTGTPKVCSPLWTTGTTKHLVESSPAVANGVVYNTSSDGNVYAYDSTTGSLLWSAPVGGLLQASPTVANGVLYVGTDRGLTAFTP